MPRTFCKAEIAGRLNGFFIYRAKCSRERFVTQVSTRPFSFVAKAAEGPRALLTIS